MPEGIVSTAIETNEVNLKCDLETATLNLNKYVMLFTRLLKIFFDERLGRVFALKQAAEFFKHVSAELLEPYEKTKSLMESLKRLAECLKSFSE